MATKNLKNAFQIDNIPENDPDLQELIALRTIKVAISEKKRKLKDKSFEKDHPAVTMLQKELERKKKIKEAKTLDKVAEAPVAEPEPVPEPVPVPEPEPVPEPKKAWDQIKSEPKGQPQVKKVIDRNGRWLF